MSYMYNHFKSSEELKTTSKTLGKYRPGVRLNHSDVTFQRHDRCEGFNLHALQPSQSKHGNHAYNMYLGYHFIVMSAGCVIKCYQLE